MELCKDCGYLHYKTDPCREPRKQRDLRQGVGNSAASIQRGGSSASRLHSPKAGTIPNAGSSRGRTAEFDSANTGSNPVPASKPKRGRPRIHADRKAYKAQKQREYRAKLKAQKEMGK